MLADLNSFYYTSATRQTRSARWGIDLYWSNGNEMHNKGVCPCRRRLDQALTRTPRSQGSSPRSGRCTTRSTRVDPATGLRRFPDAHAGSDPTTEAERSGWVEEWLHASAKYHDFVAWSIYPAGRKDTVDDPTFNWPSLNPADANLAPHGYMVRTSSGSGQATLAAGLPMGSIELHVGETGTGDDPDDSTTRPYWAVNGFMHPLMTLSRDLRHPRRHRQLVGQRASAGRRTFSVTSLRPRVPRRVSRGSSGRRSTASAVAPSPRPGWRTRMPGWKTTGRVVG